MNTVSAERPGKTNSGCYNCRSAATVAEKTVCYFSRAGNSPLYVENMPVEVCRVCGIVVFPNPSRAALKQARAGELIPVAYRRAPVFDLKTPDAELEKAFAGGRLSNIMTICYNCRSIDTEAPTLVRHFSSAGTEPYFLENLPVHLCRLCGKGSFSWAASCMLTELIKGKHSPIAHRRVPVFDLKNPDAKPEKAKAAATVPALAEVPGD